MRRLREYGFPKLSIDRLKVSIVEAAPRLLPRLPERIGLSVAEELGRIDIDVRLNTQVSRVERDRVHTKDGLVLDADISVWAAGVRAPAFLGEAGFPVDRLGRIRVERDLSVTGRPDTFAIGDCCAFTSEDRYRGAAARAGRPPDGLDRGEEPACGGARAGTRSPSSTRTSAA